MKMLALLALANYATMAPIDQYRMKAADEIALAKSAAPPSIANDAQVLVLGAHGYLTAAPGTNGFVCVVERAWANQLEDAEFWNPKVRAPICFNPQGARSVLAQYLKRTEWVLAGLGKPQILERTKAALADKTFTVPEPGSMCYMLSVGGHLGDSAGHWMPHLMFFLPQTDAASWGGNLPGSPVFVLQSGLESTTVFLVPVRNWSDGSPAPDHKP